MSCSISCKTQDHETYGDCLQSKGLGFVGVSPTRDGWDQTKVKADNKELNDYWAATKAGIEPRSTKQVDIDAAVKLSNEAGKAFNGITMAFKD